ncbi:MAG: glycosyltransferase [candidate division Zixibacteria bacterium]|nr:glycosyltransferase [candidate division Zixibacteria bacterium]
MKLSIVIPVYNEEATVKEIIDRCRALPLDKEVVVVDDGSSDGTANVLAKEDGVDGVAVRYHEKNRGKGAAIRTGIEECTGDIVVIQDADLEYVPEEFPDLIQPIVDGYADVVYGSRFLGTHRVFKVLHYFGNKFLTLITNILYDTMLTDMETCYKAFRAEVIKNVRIKSDRFNFEPEITAKVFKQKKLRVYEMPISYHGRDYDEGKKITWLDGIPALWALIKYRFTD